MVLSTVEDTGNGATFTFGTTSYAIRIKKINGVEVKGGKLEVTNLSHTTRKRFIADDLTETSDLVVEGYFDTTKAPPTIHSTAETATITFPVRTNGGEAVAATLAGTGFLTSFKYPDLANGEVQMCQFTFTWDGTTGPAFTLAT